MTLPFDPTAGRLALVAGSYALLLGTSGVVVSTVLGLVSTDDSESPLSERERDVGALVGKCENALTLTFVLASAYTALAVVFAAKGIVRKADIEKNTLFYLAGTLVNLTYSVLWGNRGDCGVGHSLTGNRSDCGIGHSLTRKERFEAE